MSYRRFRKTRPVPMEPLEAGFDLFRWAQLHMQWLEGSPPEIVTVCPRCGKPKCAINTEIKGWHCLSASCDFKGWQLVDLIREVKGWNYAMCLAEMTSYTKGVDLEPILELEGASEAREIPEIQLPPSKPIDGYVRSWVLRRDPDRGEAQRFAQKFAVSLIDYGGSTGSKAETLLQGRLLIPAFLPTPDSKRLKPVYWTARAVRGESPKTINMPRPCRHYSHLPHCTCAHRQWGLPLIPYAATAREVVLGLHLVEPGSTVVVVEGDMDAVTCGPGFVATYGAHCTPEQARLIATVAANAVVFFDGDAGGDVGRLKAAEELSKVLPTSLASCPRGEDPGSLGRTASLDAIRFTEVPVGGVHIQGLKSDA